MAARRTQTLSCIFQIESGDFQLYSFGAISRWRNPQSSQIAYREHHHYSSQLVGQVEADTELGNYGTYECSVDWNVIPWGYIGTSTGSQNVSPKCPSTDLSTLVDEYYSPKIYGVNYRPGCSDFTQGVAGSTDFDWSEWTVDQGGSHDGWALAEHSVFPDLMQTTRNIYVGDYDGVALVVWSGYRCPHKNASITPAGAPDSRHQYGDAVDFTPLGSALSAKNRQWGNDEWWYLTSAGIEAGFTWYEEWGTGSGQTTSHSHLDKR